MKFSHFSESEQWLIRISSILFVAAALVWMWVLFIPMVTSKPKRKSSKTIWVQPTPGRVQARWEEVKQLREKMRPWVEKHRDAINRMRSGDVKAFEEVYAAIPVNPDAAVIGIGSPDVLEFTWNCHVDKIYGQSSKNAKTVTQKREASSVEIGEAILKTGKEKYHDIAIADSCLPGQMNYVLWASGRVTEVYKVDGCRYLDCFTERTHKEVVPPL